MSSLSKDKTFGDLKEILMKVEHKDAAGETNLYDHILQIFNILIMENVNNGYGVFEEISYAMKYMRYPSLFPDGNVL